MNNISPVRYNIQTYQNPNYSQNLITTPSFKGNITQKIFTNKKAGFPIIASILAFIGFSTKNMSVKKPAEEVNKKKMFSEIKSAANNKRNKAREAIYQKYNREYEALCIKTTGRNCKDLVDTVYKECESTKEKAYFDLVSLSNKNSILSKAVEKIENGEISLDVYFKISKHCDNEYFKMINKAHDKCLEIYNEVNSLKNERYEALKKVDDEYEETINAAKSKYNITETHKEKPVKETITENNTLKTSRAKKALELKDKKNALDIRKKAVEAAKQEYKKEYKALCIKYMGKYCKDLVTDAEIERTETEMKAIFELLNPYNPKGERYKAEIKWRRHKISNEERDKVFDATYAEHTKRMDKANKKVEEIRKAVELLEKKRNEAIGKADKKYEKATGTKYIEPKGYSYYEYSNPYRETANYQSCYVLHGQNYGVFSEREIRRNWH